MGYSKEKNFSYLGDPISKRFLAPSIDVLHGETTNYNAVTTITTNLLNDNELKIDPNILKNHQNDSIVWLLHELDKNSVFHNIKNQIESQNKAKVKKYGIHTTGQIIGDVMTNFYVILKKLDELCSRDTEKYQIACLIFMCERELEYFKLLKTEQFDGDDDPRLEKLIEIGDQMIIFGICVCPFKLPKYYYRAFAEMNRICIWRVRATAYNRGIFETSTQGNEAFQKLLKKQLKYHSNFKINNDGITNPLSRAIESIIFGIRAGIEYALIRLGM